MSENRKIHRILDFICSKENQSSFETDEIAKELNLSLSEINQLARKIIENGDARDCSSKMTSRKGAKCLLRITATKDAFETKRYLQEKESLKQPLNINAQNVQVGNNYGSYEQESHDGPEINNEETDNKDGFPTFMKWIFSILGAIAAIATVYEIFFA